jgi:hypothetical protein
MLCVSRLHSQLFCLSTHLCCSLPSEASEAVVLDMGEYESPLIPLLPFTPTTGAISNRLLPCGGFSSGLHWMLPRGHLHVQGDLPLVQQQVQRARTSFSGGPSMDKCSFHRHANKLRLYQILSPALAGRAWVWGNKMSLKEDWGCTDMPYFEAPGKWTCSWD